MHPEKRKNKTSDVLIKGLSCCVIHDDGDNMYSFREVDPAQGGPGVPYRRFTCKKYCPPKQSKDQKKGT